MAFGGRGFSFVEFLNLKEVTHILRQRCGAEIALLLWTTGFLSSSSRILTLHPVRIRVLPGVHLGTEGYLKATRASPSVPGRPWPLADPM